MSDQHSESLQSSVLMIWKSFLYSAIFIMLAIIFFYFRKAIVGAVITFAAYIVWSLNIVGSVIPQQVLWILMLLLILYIAVGSFYGKHSESRPSQKNAVPVVGPVEARARWIDERQRGTYFKWLLANLLGKVHQHIQESVFYGNPRDVSLIPSQIQDYLNAGLNTTYADYSTPNLFQKTETTPLDIQLDQVVDYLEDELEINDER